MHCRIIFFLSVIFLCVGNGWSQPILPKYRQYTLRDGLSQMQVTCLLQDRRGYIWVGTKAGLNCFNGEKFTSYTTKKYPQIENDQLVDLREDSKGRIWGSTVNGLIRIDGQNVKFFHSNSNIPYAFDCDTLGRVWFCQTNYPLPSYKLKYIEGDSIYSPKLTLPECKYYASRLIQFYKPDNTLLLAIDSILYRLKDDHFEEVDHNSGDIYFFPNAGDKVYYLDGKEHNDIVRADIKNSDLKQYANGKSKIVASIRNYRNLYAPKLEHPLVFTQPALPNVTIYLSPDSLSYRFTRGLQLNALLLDREGHIWLGGEEGLFRLFDDAFTTYRKDYLPGIWSFLEDSKNNLWFGSYIHGLFKLENGKLRKFFSPGMKEVAYPYFHPSMDKRGRLFFPNASGMLMIDGNKYEQHSGSYIITSFYDKSTDLLWAGSHQQASVFDSTLQQVRIINDNQGLKVGKNVLTIGKDKSGYFWLGGGDGLARYNYKSDQLKNYNLGEKKPGVYTQCNDYKGRTWFGAKDGLYFYDSDLDSIKQLKCNELNDLVASIACIDSTWLLATQPYGIYLMDLQEYYQTGKVVLRLYNEKNGFTGVEPGQDGVYVDSKGKVWITTSTEVITLDPSKLKVDQNKLLVRIDKCNGIKLPFESQKIALSANQNTAVLTFDAVSFNRPNPVQYSWRIGKDTIWSDWQEENYAVISGLEDGLTKVIIRARINGLPLTHTTQTEILLNVRMAIYRQSWFFPSLFIFISLIGTSLLAFSILQFRKAGKEAKVFQMQAIQSQMNPHFIFNALASIQSMILKMNVAKANEYLVKLAELIRGFLEASIGTGSIKSSNSIEGMLPIASELKILADYVEFQQTIYPDRFDYLVILGEGLDPENEYIPPMLIQPFVENAIRHGLLPGKGKGLLKVIFEKVNRIITITVEDNGIGINQSDSMLKSSPLSYRSRGKELTFNRIRLMNQIGFNIDVKTESSDKGTKIQIIIQTQW